MQGQINYNEVSDIANEIERIANEINTALDEVKKQMSNAENTWESAAADVTFERFTALASKFESFYNLVIEEAKVMRDAVAAYQADDASTASSAGNLAS